MKADSDPKICFLKQNRTMKTVQTCHSTLLTSRKESVQSKLVILGRKLQSDYIWNLWCLILQSMKPMANTFILVSFDILTAMWLLWSSGYDSIQSGRWVSVFWKNLLPPCLGQQVAPQNTGTPLSDLIAVHRPPWTGQLKKNLYDAEQ
jgi:hypothetical protein